MAGVRRPSDGRARGWALRGLTAMVAATLSCAALFLTLEARGPAPATGSRLAAVVSSSVIGAVFVVIAAGGWVIVGRVPGNAVGWLLASVGLLLLAAAAGEAYAQAGAAPPGTTGAVGATLPGASGVAIAASGAFGLATFAFLATLAVFPTGRPASRRSGAIIAAIGGVSLLGGAAGLLAPGPVDGILTGQAAQSNPIAVPGLAPALSAAGFVAGDVALPLLAAAVAASMVARLRAARGDERRQMKWVLLAAACALLAVPLDPLLGADGVLFLAGLLALPLAIGAGMLRYRLYAVDMVVNRALFYAIATGLIAGIYAVVVVAAGTATRARVPTGAAVAATVIVAFGLLPLRTKLQRLVNRLTFGRADNPRDVLRALGRLLEAARSPERVLPAVAAGLAQALRLAYVAIDLAGEDGPSSVTSVGAPGQTPQTQVPLTYRGEAVGQLRFVGRPDRETVADLAPQIAAAAAAVRLTRDVQRSRARLVTAREEERRRIHRDLHDGLGPLLAGVGIQVELIRSLMASDPNGVDRLLGELKSQSLEGVAEVRRIVNGLRPVVLDQLGLAGALTQRARALSHPGRDGDSAARTGARVEVRVAGDLATLPAAIEVAAYHITVEAMTNAVRHAGACQIDASLSRSDATLTIEVRDDGRGLPASISPGLGLSSMRERAGEVGGGCAIDTLPDQSGTLVRACLPVGRP